MSPDVNFSIIWKTATLRLSMDPPVSLPLPTTHSQPQPKCCSHCEVGWMDGWMDGVLLHNIFPHIPPVSIFRRILSESN
jgi:hypothetical protein